MNASNQVKSKMMKAAWAGAKQAAAKFGGKASQYISETMKMVWAESKKTVAIKLSSMKVSLDAFRSVIKTTHVKLFTVNVVECSVFEFAKAQVLNLIG